MATVRIQLRRGTAAEWTAVDPVLAPGEMGLETDTGDFKFGDGNTAWSDLSYALGDSVDDYIPLSQKGVADGVATLDSSGLIPLAQLPGAAALDAEVSSAISVHNSDTTDVHGIADTSILVTTTGNQTLTSKSLTSPALTGTPTAPTPAAGTDTTQIATTAFVQDAIELVVGAAPAALNTLAEIATSLDNDADLAGTLTTAISAKVAKAGDTMTGPLILSGDPTQNLHPVTKQYLDTAIATGVSYSDTSVENHRLDTTNVHGIANTADLVTTSMLSSNLADYSLTADVDATFDDVNTEIASINNVLTTHGTDIGTLQTSTSGHYADTTDVHGITNTADIVYSADLANVISNHNSDTTSVHGIADTSLLATKSYADDEISNSISTHNLATTNVHGIADTAALALTADVNSALDLKQDKVSGVSDTEIGYLDGVTSAIQTQLDGKSNTSHTHGITEIPNLFEELSSKANLSGANFTGNVEVDGNLVVDGDFTVNGTNFSASATSITIEDNLVQLAHQNSANTVDLGLVVAYNDGSAKHAGIVRDVSDAKWKLFKGVLDEPSTVVNFGQGSLDDLSVNNIEVSGVVFSDKTQTKAGVPSLTTIANEVSSNTTLDNLGTDAQVRDSLIPLSGSVQVTFEATGNNKYAVGSSISFYQSSGTGANIVGSGITILSTPGSTLRTTNSSVTATKVGSTTWLLAGDLKA